MLKTPQKFNKAQGVIQLNWQLNNQAKQFYTIYQQAPLRMLFPKMLEIGIPCAVLINISGGLTGGDEHKINITVGKGTKAFITTQAAEKIYHSPVLESSITTRIETQENSWCEWIPQETILFDQARLKRAISFYTSLTSEILAGEILVFGRLQCGEKFQSGFFQDNWEIYVEGKLIWKEMLHLKERSTLNALTHPAGFNNATSYGTIIYIGHQARIALEPTRNFLKKCKIQNSATVFDTILLVRFLSKDPYQLRLNFTQFWCFFRHRFKSLPNVMPCFWRF